MRVYHFPPHRRIIEWQIGSSLSAAFSEFPEYADKLPGLKHGMVDESGMTDLFAPRRLFDCSLVDRTGPPRMFVGLDCRDFASEGAAEPRLSLSLSLAALLVLHHLMHHIIHAGGNVRKICAGDTENDIWQITQKDTMGADGYPEEIFKTVVKEDPLNSGNKNEVGIFPVAEGQSDAVHGIAPYPVLEAAGDPGTMGWDAPTTEQERSSLAESQEFDSSDKARKDKGAPSAEIFATGCEDGCVTIWNAGKRDYLRKLEVRRHGGLSGQEVPRGTSIGDLLRVKACAFSHDGKMLAVSTCGVRQWNETLVVTLPKWCEPSQKLVVHIKDNSVLTEHTPAEIYASESDIPARPDGKKSECFEWTAPKNARPGLQVAIDMPIEHTKKWGGFGQYNPPGGLEQIDLGGTVLVYGFDKVEKWAKKDDSDKMTGKFFAEFKPTLLYEEKISLEAIDVLAFSPDDSMLAAGSHDNFVYVLGKALDFDDQWEDVNWEHDVAEYQEGKPFFERAGVCTCHSSYITSLDWGLMPVDPQPEHRVILKST